MCIILYLLHTSLDHHANFCSFCDYYKITLSYCAYMYIHTSQTHPLCRARARKLTLFCAHPERDAGSSMTNVLVELQRRQWRQVESWNVKSLRVFCEEKALHLLRHSVTGDKNYCTFGMKYHRSQHKVTQAPSRPSAVVLPQRAKK